MVGKGNVGMVLAVCVVVVALSVMTTSYLTEKGTSPGPAIPSDELSVSKPVAPPTEEQEEPEADGDRYLVYDIQPYPEDPNYSIVIMRSFYKTSKGYLWLKCIMPTEDARALMESGEAISASSPSPRSTT